MALAKTVVTVHGLQALNAYHRVESVALQNKETITFRVRSYTETDKPFFIDNALSCAYDLDGANPIKQAYEHLKTLPEFEGAVDC
jgi:hypothetical protein